MKKTGLTFCLLFFVSIVGAQQFSLYNSRTLYDAFENPSQKAFQADSSRKFAFNLFIPTVSFNGAFIGPAQKNFKALIYNKVLSGTNLAIGQGETSNFSNHSNNYMLMFRIFRSVNYNLEMGFSWQIRNDGQANVSNSTFAILDNYRLFQEDQYDGIFNNNGYNQSYNQYSFTYREDYNKRLSLGAKLSLLSGITYHRLNMQESALFINRDLNEYDILLKGNFETNVVDADLNWDIINPTFHDPGLSLGLSANYKFRGGWFLMGNLKDIGFIKWNKDSYNYNFDTAIKIENASSSSADERLRDEINVVLKNIKTNKQFTSMINGKAEALLNKDFGKYQPNFILSKNLFYPGGHVALVNNYMVKNFVFTATADYNLDEYFQLGGQFMIKTPNVEFFLGSDYLVKTYQTTRSLLSDNPAFDDGISAASAYIGFALKFGPVMEHPANANFIPGMNADHDRTGWFKRLLGRR